MRLFWILMILLAGGLILLVVNHDEGMTFGMANEQFGQALYISVWGLAVAAGLVGARLWMGDMVRNLAIWLAIILGLVAGYQYRYELQDIASRVTAGLVPASPLSMRMEGTGNAVRLDKLRNGHFEVRADVDGRPVRFMIDTGATTTVLTADDAAAIGIDQRNLSYTIPVSTANGIARAARATVGEIRIASIARNRVNVLIAAPGSLERSLLGMNFIGSLTGFDIRGDVMTLID